MAELPVHSTGGRIRRPFGLKDVEFVYAEGLAISEASKQAALSRARQAIERLSAPVREAIAA